MIVLGLGDVMRISNNEIIGKRITRYRKRGNLTQGQLSELINISVTEISNLERGKNNLSYSTLTALCNTLDVCPCQLLSGTRRETVEQNIIDIIHELSKEEQETLYRLLITYFDNKNM